MLATQCTARAHVAARGRGTRAQLAPALPAAAPQRPPRSLAAARGARCSRKRVGAVRVATHSGADLADTPALCALHSRRVTRSVSAPRRLVTTCGLPIPVIGPLLSSPLVTVAWLLGAFKLFTGFSKTTYSDDALIPKLALCALWCGFLP